MHCPNVFVCATCYQLCTVVQTRGESGIGDKLWGIMFFSGTATGANDGLHSQAIHCQSYALKIHMHTVTKGVFSKTKTTMPQKKFSTEQRYTQTVYVYRKTTQKSLVDKVNMP